MSSSDSYLPSVLDVPRTFRPLERWINAVDTECARLSNEDASQPCSAITSAVQADLLICRKTASRTIHGVGVTQIADPLTIWLEFCR